MRRDTFAQSVLQAFGDLFDFVGPVKSYLVASADEITCDAWSNEPSR